MVTTFKAITSLYRLVWPVACAPQDLRPLNSTNHQAWFVTQTSARAASRHETGQGRVATRPLRLNHHRWLRAHELAACRVASKLAARPRQDPLPPSPPAPPATCLAPAAKPRSRLLASDAADRKEGNRLVAAAWRT